MRSAFLAAWLGVITAAGPAVAANAGEETPKHGGTLTYMIPADAQALMGTGRGPSPCCMRWRRSTVC
jgi:hypothetical protein